jgi:distribution and morphology protein 34
MLGAKQPLVVPMLLRLSNFKLNSYVVLVVSKQKGITLVFKTDPLQNVDINSTFDSIAVIQNFIQKEIEGQLRQMFREDLPGIIHRLSQQWVKAKVEAPYLKKRPPSVNTPLDTESSLDFSYTSPSLSSVNLTPNIRYQQSLRPTGYRRSSSSSSSAIPNRRPIVTSPTASADPTPSFPDLENFDPTYGLRPEGLPMKSGFSGFSSLFTPNRGLADLAEEISEEGDYDDEAGSFDIVDWENALSDGTPPRTVSDHAEDATEYETIPAVGGGTITRPRIYHSQSLARAPSDIALSMLHPAQSNTQKQKVPYSQDYVLSPHLSEFASPHFPAFSTSYSDPPNQRLSSIPESSIHSAPLYTSFRRTITPDSLETQASSATTRSIPTPPSEPPHSEEETQVHMKRPTFDHRLSQSSSDGFHLGSPPKPHTADSDPKIILRPSLNNTIHQLSTLSHSNHTLSPYTRSVEHFTVRSVPPRSVGPSGLSQGTERQPVKARRKRTYRLGRTKDTAQDSAADVPQPPPSPPVPPSEFDASDLDRYFRSQDSLADYSPDTRPITLHRRHNFNS